ncbi:hypothetical protein [Curtobacterium aetherium]|nr:hypothetical protein [Curtobacterium sp. L6-1]
MQRRQRSVGVSAEEARAARAFLTRITEAAAAANTRLTERARTAR